MTKVAIWCRHAQDNLIAVGKNIPWQIKSDSEFFIHVVEGGNVVMGRLTYEALPNRTIPNCKIYVLTSDYTYKVSDKDNHFVVSDVRDFKDFPEDLYIAGGAKVYESFLTGGAKLLPDIVVDCVYDGEILPNLKGDKINISSCLPVLAKKYAKVAENQVDGVERRMLIKRGDFVDQAVMKKILTLLQN